ncbi:MAG: NTP transferase domain-containing protein, partial [Bacteroidales bacterium]|nr:NTP transferase domain-containing protein [Bacteroidales bacterium]
MKYFAVITGGGTGSRMGNAVAKQFLPLHGLPVIMHTIRHFQLLADTVFVTLPKQWFEYWQHLQEEYA